MLARQVKCQALLSSPGRGDRRRGCPAQAGEQQASGPLGSGAALGQCALVSQWGRGTQVASVLFEESRTLFLKLRLR